MPALRLVPAITAALLFSLPVQASLQLPDAPALQQIGSGSLRKFGFTIYEASTWSTQPSLATDGSITAPFALQIIYARDIAAEDLVDATAEAWDKLNLLDADGHRWLPLLATMWPDVKAGDVLVLHINAEGNASFYFNSTRLGQINEPAFGPRFAAIWLHPDCSEPSLRRQLLGHQKP